MNTTNFYVMNYSFLRKPGWFITTVQVSKTLRVIPWAIGKNSVDLSINLLVLSNEQYQYTHRLSTVVGAEERIHTREGLRGVPSWPFENADVAQVVVGRENSAGSTSTPNPGFEIKSPVGNIYSVGAYTQIVSRPSFPDLHVFGDLTTCL